MSGSRFYFLTGAGAAAASSRCSSSRWSRRGRPASRQVDRAGRWSSRERWRVRASWGRHAEEVYRIEAEDLYLVGTSRGADGGLPLRRDPRRLDAAAALRRRSAPASARRPARTARTPAGSSACTGSTRWRCSPTPPSRSRYAEHQRLLAWEKEFLDKLELAYRVIDVAAGDLGLVGAAEVRLRGVDPDPGQVPRADLDLQLHRLPGPPARHRALSRRRGRAEVAGGDAQRHALRDHPPDRGDPRDPPAGGRLGPGAEGAAALLGGREVLEPVQR